MSRLYLRINDLEVTVESQGEFPQGAIDAAMQLAAIGLREAVTAGTAPTPAGVAVKRPYATVVTNVPPAKQPVRTKPIKTQPVKTQPLSNPDLVRQALASKPLTLDEISKQTGLDNKQVFHALQYLRQQGTHRRWEMARKAEAV